MLGSVVSVPVRLVDLGGSVVGARHGTEEPRYTVEQQIPGVEIRRYGLRIAAETAVAASEEAARNEGFRRLAGYIFGANHAAAKIAMTAPVAQQPSIVRGQKIVITAPMSQRASAGGEWVIRLFMPADKTMESLPEPDDDAINLVTVPAETVAVRRFTGSRSRRAIASQTAELMRTLPLLRNKGFEPTGPPAAWFYDPPWTIPMLRRNEVVVFVEPQPVTRGSMRGFLRRSSLARQSLPTTVDSCIQWCGRCSTAPAGQRSSPGPDDDPDTTDAGTPRLCRRRSHDPRPNVLTNPGQYQYSDAEVSLGPASTPIALLALPARTRFPSATTATCERGPGSPYGTTARIVTWQ